jgi:hypothetical protein
MVIFVSITYSERNGWNGPIVAPAISREKRKPVLAGHGCLADRAAVVCPGICAMSQFCGGSDALSDGNLNVVVTNKTKNVPLSNGSDIMYFCSVIVKIWFCKLLR